MPRILDWALQAQPPEQPGARIGPYKLLQKVGEGGFGVVWMAEQEQPIRRRVALKIIKVGMDTREVIARFEAERQALALMDHPNIAHVFDAGATTGGRPFFVMELVRGVPITRYCDENRLSTEARLRLFIAVCHGVQHAHQKGIIHRDLKPSNILVTLHDGIPVPKIIDFGIAKATSGVPLTDKTLFTQFHTFIGTPAYTSPEQIELSGLDVDTRSDIYSLGVLLYELLAGRTPFDADTLAKSGLEAMRRTLREVDPPRPSQRLHTLSRSDRTIVARSRATDDVKLFSLLRDDLDAIALHCLEKDRARRYDTATALAADLERHLHHEPIAARSPSRVYRVGKFVRRHRLGVAAATAVFLALVAGLGFALIGFREAVLHEQVALEQKHRAETARTQAQELISFVMQDLQPDMRDHGRLESQKLTVEAAVRYFDHLPPELRDEATIRDHAEALEALAEVYGRKMNTVTIVAENIDIARDAAQKALALRRQIAAAHSDDPDAAVAVYTGEARVIYHQPELWPQIETILPDKIRKFRELEQRFPDHPAVQRLLAFGLLDWAFTACFDFGRPVEAHAAATEARERWECLLATAPQDLDVRIGYARSLALLARTFATTDEPAHAIAVGEEAIAHSTHLLDSDPNNLRLLFVAAETAGYLAQMYRTNAPSRARETERIARKHYQQLMLLDPAALEWRARYATMHGAEIHALVAEGRLADARAVVQEVITLYESAARDRDTKHRLASAMRRAASLAVQAGDAAAAQRQLAALREFSRAQTLAHPENSWARFSEQLFWLIEQCEALVTLEDWPELDRTARHGLAEIERATRELPGHEDELLTHRAAAQYFLGRALLQEGKNAEAILSLEQAVSGFRDARDDGSLLNRNERATRAADLLASARAQSNGTLPP